MAAQFKNLVTEIDTTGSNQTLLTCPTGKTIIIRTFHVANEDGSNSAYFATVADSSINAAARPIFEFAITADATATNRNPIVLESGDSFGIQTSQANQHVHLAYVILDTGTIQRYRGVCIQAETANTTNNIVTCPTGSTLILNYFTIYNHSGGDSTDNRIEIVDSSTSTTKTITDGQILDNKNAGFIQAFVLESGDQINVYIDDQPMVIYCSYLEIRNPVIRGQ
jgi:hypothetical protein|tara:strand:+ start:125 stop:796 length:672 start_codon:yes stop_codon:yes gene_type:complete